MIEVSYSEARGRLAELLDRVSDDREVVRIRRQGAKPSAVLIDADEYASLEETAHLLSSPANVRRLLQALTELQSGQGAVYRSVDHLWRELESEVRAERTSEAEETPLTIKKPPPKNSGGESYVEEPLTLKKPRPRRPASEESDFEDPVIIKRQQRRSGDKE